jgi:hypothetical protein
MIDYSYPEEKAVALIFAEELKDPSITAILQRGFVSSREEAMHLSQFFWNMIAKSAEGGIVLPFSGSTEYWTEKLYNSIGGYLEKAGYEAEWNNEIDRA